MLDIITDDELKILKSYNKKKTEILISKMDEIKKYNMQIQKIQKEIEILFIQEKYTPSKNLIHNLKIYGFIPKDRIDFNIIIFLFNHKNLLPHSLAEQIILEYDKLSKILKQKKKFFVHISNSLFDTMTMGSNIPQFSCANYKTFGMGKNTPWLYYFCPRTYIMKVYENKNDFIDNKKCIGRIVVSIDENYQNFIFHRCYGDNVIINNIIAELMNELHIGKIDFIAKTSTGKKNESYPDISVNGTNKCYGSLDGIKKLLNELNNNYEQSPLFF